MKGPFKFLLLFSVLAIVGAGLIATTYQANSIGQGRYFNYPASATGQDTLANADTITYDVPFKVTDLNRYEHKVHVYASRLTGTETIKIYLQEQMFLDNSLSHWVTTDSIIVGALASGATATYNAITTKSLTGTRLRYYVLGSGTTSSAIIKWQGWLRRKDGAES